MAIKPTRAPARRKTKSAAQSKPIQLTPEMREAKASQEWLHFMDTHSWDSPEVKIVGHLTMNHTKVYLMQEIRRLLGESIAKCKVIPFPVGGKRGVQIAKEA